MKKILIILSALLLIACEKEQRPETYYPEFGKYGINVLGSQTEFESQVVYSFAVETTTTIEIEISDISSIGVGDRDGWTITEDLIFSTNYNADLKIIFVGNSSATIKYYENQKLVKEKEISWNLFY